MYKYDPSRLFILHEQWQRKYIFYHNTLGYLLGYKQKTSTAKTNDYDPTRGYKGRVAISTHNVFLRVL